MQKVILTLFCTISIQFASGQIEIVPIPRTEEKKSSSPAARTKAVELDLPFWDDFSTSTGYPNNSLWSAGQSSWVNDVMAINAPSVGVATFDGLDSLGKPYSVNQVLAKGFADLLRSHIVRLDNVVAAERPSVYLSFFYQITGHGEAPDVDDQLTLSFKDSTDKWEPVWILENDGTELPDQFYQVIIPIIDEKFYHDKFQFRFQNFARLSGPFDTWNLDYIYLNKGRSVADLSFPDRTISRKASSMFKDYTSIPIAHFIIHPDSNLSKPVVGLHNMENLPGNPDQLDVQPVNYTSLDSIISYSKTEIKTVSTGLLDDGLEVLPALQPLEHRTVTLQTLPAASEFNLVADSLIRIKYKYWVNTGDNVLPSPLNLKGDYDMKYSPIDFRVNDTIEFEYQLEDYYAYDDGTAEFGAAINLQGAQVAYEFNLSGVQADTLVAVNLYFPRFGDESSQVIELRIWSDLSGDPAALLYKEIVSLQRSQQNIFWRKKLIEPVTVGKKFYVGWRQMSSAFITVGLDKNTESSTKMFFNTAGSWSNSTLLKGSLMIRPVIGDGPGTKPPPNTNVQEENSLTLYPNPSTGTFYLDGQADHLWICDLAGKPVAFDKRQSFDQTVVTLLNPAAGLYVIRVQQDRMLKTFKLIVQQ